MDFPYGFTVTVERPGEYGPHGTRSNLTRHTIPRCVRVQRSSSETDDGVLVVRSVEHLVCGDRDADVKTDDVLIFPDDTRWSVSGEPRRPLNGFTGWQPGCVVPIERVAGSVTPQSA